MNKKLEIWKLMPTTLVFREERANRVWESSTE